MTISSFRGRFDFLSNFYSSPVEFEGLTYANSESAFQAAKTLDLEERKRFLILQPGQAKREGRKLLLRTDWEKSKVHIMYKIVRNKFYANTDLAERLVATGDSFLIEGNTWNDRFWGVCKGTGQNNLGLILMIVRDELKGYNNK